MEAIREGIFSELPHETIQAILLQCPITAIFNAQLACQTFYRTIDAAFWKRYCSLTTKKDSTSTYHLAQIHFRFGGLKYQGLALLKSAAAFGNERALCDFGYKTVMQSSHQQATILKGFRYIHNAAKQGNDNACYLQALIQEPSLKALICAARKGIPLAQHKLGVFYSLKKMPRQSEKWLKMAVANGHAPSFITLTYLHSIFLDENPLIKNDLLAAKIFLGFKLAKWRAASANPEVDLPSYYAQFPEVRLGFVLQNSNSAALRYLKRNGTLSMAFKLGMIYALGKGVPRDPQMALNYFYDVGIKKTLKEFKWEIEFDLFECLDFITRLPRNDALIPLLQKTLHNKLRAIGNHYAIAKSIAKSMSCWLPKQTLASINQEWINAFLESFNFMNGTIAAYVLYFLNNDTAALERAIAIEQRNTSSSLKQYLLNERLSAKHPFS